MTTQIQTIREELLKGNSLSQRSALMDFGIMALPRRIADLKETGFPIKTEIKHNPMTGQRYASYSMDDEVTHIDQLGPGAVYRIYDVKCHPFLPELLKRSDGYFVADGQKDGDEWLSQIIMAGETQFFCQDWLDDGDFKVKYIGGMA